MRPFVKNLLQSAGIPSFSNPTSPRTPTTPTPDGGNAGADADSITTPQQLLTPTEGDRDTTQIPTNGSPDTMMLGDDARETASERRRRKRREKEARQKGRRGGSGSVGEVDGAGGGDREDEGVSMGGGGGGVQGDYDGGDGGEAAHGLGGEDREEHRDHEEEDGMGGWRVVGPANKKGSERDGRNRTRSQPQLVVDPTTTSAMNSTTRTERVPARPIPRLNPKAHPFHRSPIYPYPSRTIPPAKPPVPIKGLGPIILFPPEPLHPFIIDNLDPPTPAPTDITTPRSALESRCPQFPASLSKLQEVDLADKFRAGHMAALAHKVLADRLWRAVVSANYFLIPDGKPAAAASNMLPMPLSAFNSPSARRRFSKALAQESKEAMILSGPVSWAVPFPLQRAAVEKGVVVFLSRVRNCSEELMDNFTRANQEMGLRLHERVVKGRVVGRKELFEMFTECYGKRGEEGVDWRVDLMGLGVLFDARGRG